MVSLQEDLSGRQFRFGRVDGSIIGVVTLRPDGLIGGYQNENEYSWTVEAETLIFKNRHGETTTEFRHCDKQPAGYVLSGYFIPIGQVVWHTLTELPSAETPIISLLVTELYSNDGPFDYADLNFVDTGYPHTNLAHDLIETVLDVVQPKFWLEIGSMLGGSAIRTADVVKNKSAATQIVCIDPFTGDVNMWDWERSTKAENHWRFLRIERGKPTIYERFLANVKAAEHDDIVLPINATSTVGIKLIRRLFEQQRIMTLPEAIYLDSAHEPDETFLELRHSWDLLQPGGVLLGDDWGWDAVRNDVTKFAATVAVNRDNARRLCERHARFEDVNGILLDHGQWLLAK